MNISSYPIWMPFRRFVTKVHIDFPLEISGSWYIFNLKYSRSRKPYACFVSHLILLLKPSILALLTPYCFDKLLNNRCNSSLFQFRLSDFYISLPIPVINHRWTKNSCKKKKSWRDKYNLPKSGFAFCGGLPHTKSGTRDGTRRRAQPDEPERSEGNPN